MGQEVKITAVVIAKNEEKKLQGCLESLTWADEKLLINDASTDDTVRIAGKFGFKVVNAPQKAQGNYSGLRNLGIQKSNGKWIFYVDADERVTPGLRKEIGKIITNDPSHFAYAIPRRNIILGKEMLHGGWWPDYVKRLFFRSRIRKWSGDLHEEPEFDGEIGHMTSYLVHLKHDNLSEMVDKTNKWSVIEAELMFRSGHPQMNIPRFASAISREFFLRMVRQKAYLDGTEGTIYALYQVFSKFISYAKLWEMQIK